MGTVLIQLVTLGISEIVPIEQLVEKLISIFKLNPNEQVNIQNLESDSIQADNDTIAQIAAWQEANGLPVTVQPSSTADGSQPASAPTEGTAAGSTPATTEPAPAAATKAVDAQAPSAVGETGEHGEVGELGTNKPQSSV